MKIKKCFLFLLVVFNSQFLAAKESPDSTQKTSSDLSFYDGFGVGFAEFSGILCDHINFCKGDFVFGASARVSTRKYWRDFYTGPGSRYLEYKFVDEFALLGGYRVFNKESPMQNNDKRKLLGAKRSNTKLILSAGPIMRFEKARYWPDKGSGSTPFIGLILDRRKSDDIRLFGFTVSAELCYMDSDTKSGVSVLLFSSYTANGLIGGATVNWILGNKK